MYSYSFGEKKNSLAQAEWQPSGDRPPTRATLRGAVRGHRARTRSFYRAHAHPGRSCDSFNQLAKKLVSRLAASFAKPLKY